MPISFPTTPTEGDTYTYNGKTYIFTGLFWSAVVMYKTADVTVSDTEPASPSVNDLWLDIS